MSLGETLKQITSADLKSSVDAAISAHAEGTDELTHPVEKLRTDYPELYLFARECPYLFFDDPVESPEAVNLVIMAIAVAFGALSSVVESRDLPSL